MNFVLYVVREYFRAFAQRSRLGGRYDVKIKADDETVEKFSIAVKKAIEGGDWERGKIMLTTEDPLYTGKICDENEKKARIFDKIHFCLSSEQRYGKSRGFAEYVRGLMKEYDKERTP